MPGQLVVELRPRRRIAVRRIEAADQHPRHRRLDIARLRVGRVARQRVARQHRLRAAREDRDPVPRPLPAPDRAVARRRQRRRRKVRIRRLQLLQADHVGRRLLQPREQVRQPLHHVVDVERRDPHRRAAGPPRPPPPAPSLARCSAAVNPDTALRGFRSWSPSSSHSTRIAGDSRYPSTSSRVPNGSRVPWHDQRRRPQPLEMPGPELLRPPRRMERIAEAEEPGDPASARPPPCSRPARPWTCRR